MNPAYVDVNVHPAKLEVRFSNEGQIFKAIYETIKQGLTREDLVRNAIRYEHEGKGFKLEENKASFEYLKPTFHKITLNDRKRENIDNGNTVHNQTEINLEKENIENKPIQETFNQNNEPNNKNDRPAKSKIDEIIEAYRQKYSIDKDDDRINKKTFDEKVDNIKIEETEDLFGNTIEEARENKDEIFGNSTDETIIVNTLEDLDKVNTSSDQEKSENPDKTIYVQTIEQGIENNRNNIEEENDIKDDNSNVEEVYNIENIIEEKTSGLSQNTDVIDTAEINKRLAEENELKFDEMYQKAFGTEISEKRKERLKNEEKIEGVSTLKTVKNETVFRNSGVQYKVIGTVFRTYIIFEVKDEMYLLDQHAAHERVLFEKVKANYYKNEEKDVQVLLLPDIITLSYRENELAHENKDVFNKAGFEFEEFGINTVKLTAVPSMCEVLNTKELFLDILDEIDGQANSRKTRNRK